MDRSDLQQLSKEQLIELVLRLQRPDKNSRTSSKPPSTDKKEKRENSRPGGAKAGHEPHNRRLSDDPDEFRDHMPSVCEQCGEAFPSDAERDLIGEYDEIEIPPVKPYVIQPLGEQAQAGAVPGQNLHIVAALCRMSTGWHAR